MTCGAPSHEPEYVRAYHQRPERRAAARARSAETRAKKRAFLRQYKLDAGCADCGYAAHPAALQFDHVRGEKRGDIGRMTLGWAALLEELEKCDVRCANCHAVRTAEQAQGQGALRPKGN